MNAPLPRAVEARRLHRPVALLVALHRVEGLMARFIGPCPVPETLAEHARRDVKEVQRRSVTDLLRPPECALWPHDTTTTTETSP